MISAKHLRRLLTVAITATLVVVAGCGSGSGGRCPIQGSVHYADQPVDNGGIAFIPVGDPEGSERPCATGQIRAGRYDLDDRRGPNPGKYRVEITWKKQTGKKVPGEGGYPKDETEQVIPPKYNTQSELIVEIHAGHNTFDIDLKD